MAMPRYYPLPVNYDFNNAHNNSVFKHELRSKAAAVAYFDGLGGAGTITFTGTEGTDYEFHVDNGFRALSTTGQAKILISNILTDATTLLYFQNGGHSIEYECLTSQWIEAPYAPATWLVPPPHLSGGGTAISQGVYFSLESSTAGRVLLAIPQNTVSGGNYKLGTNRLEFWCTNNQASTSVLTGPVSNDGKGTFFKQRVSSTQGCLSGWTNNNPMVTPFAGADTSAHGERRGFRYSALQAITDHSSGTMFITLCNNSSTNGCPRWIRNLRLFSAPTTMNVHPKLRRVCSFGDSYSANLFGAMGTDVSPAGVSIGKGGYSGYTEAGQNAQDLPGFAKIMAENGYGLGGMYGGGQGGKAFSTTLDSEGWRNQFVTFNHPSMVFTAGMHNDCGPLSGGTMTLTGTGAQTLASLKSSILAQYVLPVVQRGCFGWGFMVMPVSKGNIDVGFEAIHNTISDMILTLPAAWDLAYPQYAGRVKVRDLRASIGAWATTNRNWKGMFIAGETVHPSSYGWQVCEKAAAEMALEWLRGT